MKLFILCIKKRKRSSEDIQTICAEYIFVDANNETLEFMA
jgi:hypothetical protein